MAEQGSGRTGTKTDGNDDVIDDYVVPHSSGTPDGKPEDVDLTSSPAATREEELTRPNLHQGSHDRRSDDMMAGSDATTLPPADTNADSGRGDRTPTDPSAPPAPEPADGIVTDLSGDGGDAQPPTDPEGAAGMDPDAMAFATGDTGPLTTPLANNLTSSADGISSAIGASGETVEATDSSVAPASNSSSSANDADTTVYISSGYVCEIAACEMYIMAHGQKVVNVDSNGVVTYIHQQIRLSPGLAVQNIYTLSYMRRNPEPLEIKR